MNNAEGIDHAIAMLQAMKNGKWVESYDKENGVWDRVTAPLTLLRVLSHSQEVRIAPEPLEAWAVLWIDDFENQRRNIFDTLAGAEKFMKAHKPILTTIHHLRVEQ